MLVNLRSRRRPRYGTFLCAVVSSLVLLLSVSLLYTRLSHSHPHFHNHLYHRIRNSRPFHHSVNYDSLLSDSVNDEISGTEEDKIDALDIIEEQQQDEDDLRNIEAEEEDEPNNFDQIKVSGHFFDHVNGVIRKAFDKRLIEELDDGSDQAAGGATSFMIGSGSGVVAEDRSKAAFGSDDVPVDDLLRRKAIQVLRIEDALLLKMGKRVSPLREGWGDWFDKKADFLRKDKMLKSNLEALNPLHNPILQDPDGVGVTGFTKGDRIVQKSLINDSKRVPFPFLITKAVGISIESRDSRLQENQIEAKVKECNTDTVSNKISGTDGDMGECALKIARAEDLALGKTQENP
ncbi:putative alpha 1,4-glycosyltransferase family protein [Senna tora]|uniref:Putative alpha 1,4-glycosyltransferase family protein n=1 Tax=Senna tora TaxID=362788 RepID=A0A834W741_9FABA|nr:putative alpha 1,4-glycosyltransferase family protein [Senna tora]